MASNNTTDVALFRYAIIAPLLSIDGPRGTLKREIKKLAAKEHNHPRRGPIAVGVGTIEEWLLRYRRGGLDGLDDSRRNDLGKSRRIDAVVAEAIADLAEARPELDGPGLLAEIATTRQGVTMPSLSTLYRFLRARGLDQRRAPTRKDHRAYAFDLAGDCWQGDVMYGPSLPTKDGQRRKTYLIAILDDATRVIVHAEFYFEQTCAASKTASSKRCSSAACRAASTSTTAISFVAACSWHCVRGSASTSFTRVLTSRRAVPNSSAGSSPCAAASCRGLIWIAAGLEGLNRLLFAFVEGEYHQRPHRGLGGDKPLDRWLRLSDGIRSLPQDVDLDALFRDEVTRRVGKDGTLTMSGRRFEAGPNFIGRKVTVRFDPFDLRSVMVITDSGESVLAYPVDLVANRYVRRQPPAAPGRTPPPPPLRSLDQLAEGMKPPQQTDHHDDCDGEVAHVG